jgi:hypothetical protein
MKWNQTDDGKPTFIATVRLYRSECDLDYYQAVERAAKEFRKKDWEIPEVFQAILRNNNLWNNTNATNNSREQEEDNAG